VGTYAFFLSAFLEQLLHLKPDGVLRISLFPEKLQFFYDQEIG